MPSIEMHYEGPLPPSSELKQYDAIVPGSARDIIENFKAESEHRRAMEKAGQKARFRYSFAAFSLILAVGALFMFMDSPKVGGTIIISTIVSIVGLFMTESRGKSSPKK
jgi:uncharacterized membrane protein